MARYSIESGRRAPGAPVGRITIVAIIVLLLVGARSIASYAIEVKWWKELGQFNTWIQMLYYSLAPMAGATVLAFIVLWVTHARALKFAGTGLGEHRIYARVSTLVLLALSWFIAIASIDTWTVVRFAGSRGLPASATVWHDAVFGKPLSFYLFDLPFYQLVRGYILAVVIFSILLYWIAARGWQLRYRFPDIRETREIDASFFRLEGGLESSFLQGAGVILLLAMAVRFYLGRYEMVYNEHGTFLVGMDYVDQKVGLPLQWVLVAASLAAAAFVWMRRWALAVSMGLALVVSFLLPRAVSALYVRPNEISLQRPYIQQHIQATRSAYGLDRTKDAEFAAEPDAPIDVAAQRPLLDNVRLWEWKPFHDTIMQRQALRTYYNFNDSDVDRYTIDGQYRQVLLSPRELDISQLPDARANWNNPAFIYTHGYGLVLAEVSRMTAEGLPVLTIDDTPPRINTKSLKLTRPELYYGEVTHDPVFVKTAQKEFNYPSGEQNAFSTYEGLGGFPISSFLMRLAAAIHEGEANIVLTDYLGPESRMMIRRKVRTRVEELAGFLEWDSDPYLVITEEGRLVWTIDGYTTSDAHPYARVLNLNGIGRVNYIRNAVKATVDAYDGTTRLYVFAPDDPIIAAYGRLFPDLFRPASEMPRDLRAHARYPETMFRIQAEIYRTYHMVDPQSFYNKEDVWDVALHAAGQGSGGTTAMEPAYVMTTLPGEAKSEFLLMIPFTPRNKNNLIGVMMGRCDGPNLGAISVLLLSKQQLIPGPMNISAYINQDQNISKDLTLWNQQGSRVLRGQILVLPVANTFLYVEPIYLQASEGSMPQLKKIVLAHGNRLIYTDSYDQALAQLSAGGAVAPPGRETTSTIPAVTAQGGAPQPASTGPEVRLQRVREQLRRYRDLAAQGRWAEAGKALEAIEAEVRQ
jgi:uncharacterized membrane protein (UPF0182 family)